MDIVIWILLLFLLFYEPIFGYFDFQRFKQKVKTDHKARLNYYNNTIIGLWVPTITILLLTIFTELTFEEIGISIPNLNTEPLGKAVTYTGLGIGLLYLLFVLYFIIGFNFSDKIKKELTKKKKEDWEKSVIAPLLPVTESEKKRWNYVSLTAGLTEEVIYRGFTLFALAYLFPNLSIWVIIVLSSFIFGLAHTYQGFLMGFVRTSVFAILFCILYIGLGSILPLILLHFLLDYIAKLGE
ncbi:CPBP family intramembrane metalloprotease [Mesobacillus maritimus]|uniref:CPBP family intramembrane glutamic endopeptidase n=1 Tax=Mesobacillus maritimus TaxID=1643336 RepID=UPI00203D595C|nr:CPBP family intramembrane glutamic endopeptidase [Mesobacillus maritimus]MCM3588354.1 CPBP family intramembrane metalloprotease [Mesobacillus maritimus]